MSLCSVFEYDVVFKGWFLCCLTGCSKFISMGLKVFVSLDGVVEIVHAAIVFIDPFRCFVCCKRFILCIGVNKHICSCANTMFLRVNPIFLMLIASLVVRFLA